MVERYAVVSSVYAGANEPTSTLLMPSKYCKTEPDDSQLSQDVASTVCVAQFVAFVAKNSEH